MDIVYCRMESVAWILSIVTSLLSIVTLLLSIVASMLSHVHHRIARRLGPPYLLGWLLYGASIVRSRLLIVLATAAINKLVELV